MDTRFYLTGTLTKQQAFSVLAEHLFGAIEESVVETNGPLSERHRLFFHALVAKVLRMTEPETWDDHDPNIGETMIAWQTRCHPIIQAFLEDPKDATNPLMPAYVAPVSSDPAEP